MTAREWYGHEEPEINMLKEYDELTELKWGHWLTLALIGSFIFTCIFLGVWGQINHGYTDYYAEKALGIDPNQSLALEETLKALREEDKTNCYDESTILAPADTILHIGHVRIKVIGTGSAEVSIRLTAKHLE